MNIVEEWNKQARYINIHLLAISALMKKIAYMNNSNSGIDEKMISWVRIRLLSRLSAIVSEFIVEWKSIMSPEFFARVAFLNEKKNSEKLIMILETIDSNMDIDMIEYMEYGLEHVKSVSDATTFTSEKIEKKNLPIFADSDIEDT